MKNRDRNLIKNNEKHVKNIMTNISKNKEIIRKLVVLVVEKIMVNNPKNEINCLENI